MRVRRIAVAVSILMCCAGIAMGQTEWTHHPDNPVIEPGPLGEFNEGGNGAGSVLFDGSTYHMWFAGYNQDGYATDIGHATSPDGLPPWEMDPNNPVLTRGAPGKWDHGALRACAVLHDGAQFHMWYSGFSDGRERAGYATSPDGSAWTKDHDHNPVMDVGPPGSWDEWYVYPGTVILEGDTYRMWYSGGAGGWVRRIGYAESFDGLHWTKRPDPVLDLAGYPGAWDSEVINPSVIFDGSDYHMWYAGYDPSGGPWSIGYAFSSEGIEWTRHSDNPVVQTADEFAFWSSVLFDGSTWHMWYTHVASSVEWISYATSDRGPGVAGVNHAQYIPAAAVASGAQGAFYQTDVDLNNAGTQPAKYQFMWLPRDEDCSEPMTSEAFSLGAGMSVRYANVLNEVFGLEPNSLGALAVLSSSPDLLAMSRTYNTPSGEAAGTYGQAIPAISPDDFILTNERRRILFASENADLRTNVGCQSGAAGSTAVSLELYDTDGTYLGRKTMSLPPWGNDQLNRVFEGYEPVNGYVDVWTPMQNVRFYCYGSVLDNVTSDPTTVLPQ